MVSMALLKWGTDEQRKTWLPPLARGEVIGSFALTERGPAATFNRSLLNSGCGAVDGDLILSGEKKWITCGQIAGVFLVFGKLEQKPLACLVRGKVRDLRSNPSKT